MIRRPRGTHAKIPNHVGTQTAPAYCRGGIVALGTGLMPRFAEAIGIGVTPVNTIESCLIPGGGMRLGLPLLSSFV